MRRPPFCPYRGCVHHRVDRRSPQPSGGWYLHSGTYTTRVRGRVCRYTCRGCHRSFSDQTFSLDYFAKRRVSYRRLEYSIVGCSGVRATARTLGCSPGTVINRTSRLARQAVGVHATLVGELELAENLTADGFESFAVSRYFPNNIHLLAGSESQFLYFCDYVSMRRSGRMSEAQRRMRATVERFYRPFSYALGDSFTALGAQVAALLSRSRVSQVILDTDEKAEYPKALARVGAIGQAMARGRLIHRRTNSRTARTAANPLFAVNYLDRQLRKDLAEHVRQSMRFARNVNNSMERLWVYLLHHNLHKRYRINQPVIDRRTHAQVAGLSPQRIADVQRSLYSQRWFRSRVTLSGTFDKVWKRRYPTPLRQVDRRLLHQVTRRARKGWVDLIEVIRQEKTKRIFLNRPEYVPAYALA